MDGTGDISHKPQRALARVGGEARCIDATLLSSARQQVTTVSFGYLQPPVTGHLRIR